MTKLTTTTGRNSLNILNTDIQRTNVLIAHNDPRYLAHIEAQAEQDPTLQRIQVFTAESFDEMRRIARQHQCDLAIYPDPFGGHDFVTIQIELRNAQPNIQLLPAIGIPTIQQLREARKAGGVMDFISQKDLDCYATLTGLLMNYLREHANNQLSNAELFEHVSTLRECLLLEHAEWKKIKSQSQALTNAFIIHFDLSATESARTLAAEYLFHPWIQPAQYVELLKKDKFNLLEMLHSTASWQTIQNPPKSTPGFLITAANYCAHQLHQRETIDAIVQDFSKRPDFLKHPSIRTLSGERLTDILVNETGSLLEVKCG